MGKPNNYQLVSRKKSVHTMEYSAYKINTYQGNEKHTQQINETTET